jgi:hypothetical protein
VWWYRLSLRGKCKSALPPIIGQPGQPSEGFPLPEAFIIPLQNGQLSCFCLEVFASGGFRIATYQGKPYLETFLDNFEIVDIKPDGLEGSLECYINLLMKLKILPGVRTLLENSVLNLTQGATDLFPKPTNIRLSPIAISDNVANNPAIEENQLKILIKAELVQDGVN